jgi:hypothetical protein
MEPQSKGKRLQSMSVRVIQNPALWISKNKMIPLILWIMMGTVLHAVILDTRIGIRVVRCIGGSAKSWRKKARGRDEALFNAFSDGVCATTYESPVWPTQHVSSALGGWCKEAAYAWLWSGRRLCSLYGVLDQ